MNPIIRTFNYNLLYTELGIVILCPRVLIQKALDVYHSEITPSDELDNEEMEENRVLVEVVNESGETIQPNEGDGEDERQKQKPIVCILSIYPYIYIYIILVYFYSYQNLLS